MEDEGKTKEQLIDELNELRRRVAELKESEGEQKDEGEALSDSREIDLEKLTKQKQSALEERYRALFENSPIETIVVDHKARVTGSNLAKGKPGGRIPNIGDVMYKDFAGKHEINMYNELMKCMKSGVSKEFPKQKYNGSFLQIRISPFSEGAIITSIDITDRVLAEDSMRKSQRQLRVLAHALESSSQPFAVGYPDGRIMTYNAAFCKLTGYTKEELHKVKYFTDISPEEWHLVMEKAEAKIRQTQQPQRFETEYMRKDGSRVPVEVFEHPIYGSDGNLQNYYLFFSDIKNRKLMEGALREIEARYLALVENNPIETVIVDGEAKVIDSNLSVIYPGAKPPNIGDVMFRDYGREFGTDMHKELIACIKSGESKEFREQKYGDRYLCIKMSSFSGGAIITLVDKTALKGFDTSLKALKEDYRRMFDSIGTATVIIEGDMTLSMVNNEFERLSGYARQDLEGKMGLIEFVAKQEAETVKSYYTGIRDGAMPTEYEFSFVDRKGNEKVMVSRVGKISGAKTYIVSLFDMSASEHELQLCVDELSQAHHEFTQYAQALSYDLRTPMRAIRNYVDFLREDLEETLKKDHKAYLDGLDRALREAGDLVEGLLALLQINEKGTPTEKVHMGDFFRELIDALRPLPDINIMIGGDDWPTIEAQPILLRQIFHALIDNAVKFNNSALKLIEIDWNAVDDEAFKFYVRDNGIGIKQRYKDKIFGVFERLHTLEEYPGTGIGLAIVKKCTVELGGSVHMESEFGAGSTFFVTIPKVKEKTH